MSKDKIRGVAPAEWEKLFQDANVRVEELTASKSARAKAVKIGQFLSPLVGRGVPIQVKGRTGQAVLRVQEGRAKEKRYFFEVVWEAPATEEPAPSGAGKPSGAKKHKTTKKTGKAAQPKELDTPKKTTRSAQTKETTTKRSATQSETEHKQSAAGKEKGTKKKPGTQGGGNDLDW